MKEILLEPVEVWGYYQKHLKELEGEPLVIAENKEYGVEITMSSENNYPLFIVTADGYQREEESATSEDDCYYVVEELYDQYLTEKFITLDDEELTALDQQDAIFERETELDEMIMAMLSIALEQDPEMCIPSAEIDDVIEDIKDHFLEYIARKHNLPIYRPMILEDADGGADFFAEYPYEYMEFDDEDNPIYK